MTSVFPGATAAAAMSLQAPVGADSVMASLLPSSQPLVTRASISESMHEIIELRDGSLAVNRANWRRFRARASNTARAALVSFVGDTSAGKSFLIGCLLGNEESRPFCPPPGTQNASTTFNVNLFSSDSYLQDRRVHFLDFEGENGTDVPALAVARTASGQVVDREARHEAVHDMFPKLSYILSDVVVVVCREPFVNRRYLDRCIEFAKSACYGVMNVSLPSLLLVCNKAPGEECILEVERSTEQFFEVWGAEAQELGRYFASVKCIYVPHARSAWYAPDGALVDGRTVFRQQLQALRDLITSTILVHDHRASVDLNERLWFSLLPKVLRNVTQRLPVAFSSILDATWTEALAAEESKMDNSVVVFRATISALRPPLHLSCAAAHFNEDFLLRFIEFRDMAADLLARAIAARLRSLETDLLVGCKVKPHVFSTWRVVDRLLDELTPCLAVYAGTARATERSDEPVACLQERRSHDMHRASRVMVGGGGLWGLVGRLRPYNPAWAGAFQPPALPELDVTDAQEMVMNLTHMSDEEFVRALAELAREHTNRRRVVMLRRLSCPLSRPTITAGLPYCSGCFTRVPSPMADVTAAAGAAAEAADAQAAAVDAVDAAAQVPPARSASCGFAPAAAATSTSAVTVTLAALDCPRPCGEDEDAAASRSPVSVMAHAEGDAAAISGVGGGSSTSCGSGGAGARTSRNGIRGVLRKGKTAGSRKRRCVRLADGALDSDDTDDSGPRSRRRAIPGPPWGRMRERSPSPPGSGSSAGRSRSSGRASRALTWLRGRMRGMVAHPPESPQHEEPPAEPAQHLLVLGVCDACCALLGDAVEPPPAAVAADTLPAPAVVHTADEAGPEFFAAQHDSVRSADAVLRPSPRASAAHASDSAAAAAAATAADDDSAEETRDADTACCPVCTVAPALSDTGEAAGAGQFVLRRGVGVSFAVHMALPVLSVTDTTVRERSSPFFSAAATDIVSNAHAAAAAAAASVARSVSDSAMVLDGPLVSDEGGSTRSYTESLTSLCDCDATSPSDSCCSLCDTRLARAAAATEAAAAALQPAAAAAAAAPLVTPVAADLSHMPSADAAAAVAAAASAAASAVLEGAQCKTGSPRSPSAASFRSTASSAPAVMEHCNLSPSLVPSPMPSDNSLPPALPRDDSYSSYSSYYSSDSALSDDAAGADGRWEQGTPRGGPVGAVAAASAVAPASHSDSRCPSTLTSEASVDPTAMRARVAFAVEQMTKSLERVHLMRQRKACATQVSAAGQQAAMLRGVSSVVTHRG